MDTERTKILGNPSALTGSTSYAIFAVLNVAYAAGIWFYLKDIAGCDKRE